MRLLVLVLAIWRVYSEVKEFQSSELPNFLSAHEQKLRVVYYHSSSTFCKEFSPKLSLAAHNLPEVEFAKVASQKHSGPYIDYYLSGSQVPRMYHGLFETDYLIASLQSKIFKLQEVKEPLDFEKAIKSYESGVVLGLFEDLEGEAFKEFLEFAKENSGLLKFLYSKREGNWLSEHSQDTLVLYKQSYLNFTDFYGKVSEVVLNNFYTGVNYLNREAFYNLLERNRTIVMLVTNFNPKASSANFRYYSKRLQETTQNLDNLVVGISYKEEFTPELEKDIVNLDQLLLGIYTKDQKFILREENLLEENSKLNQTAIAEFLENYQKGKLKPFIKTQKPPHKEYENGVRVIVADNFKQKVIDSDKDEVVYIYTQADFHSKRFLKEYEKLTKSLKKYKDLRFNKIDGGLNELPPQYQRTKFPTIYFASKENKEKPLLFQKPLSYNNLYYFVKDKVYNKEDL